MASTSSESDGEPKEWRQTNEERAIRARDGQWSETAGKERVMAPTMPIVELDNVDGLSGKAREVEGDGFDE